MPPEDEVPIDCGVYLLVIGVASRGIKGIKKISNRSILFQDKEKSWSVIKFIATAFAVYVSWFCFHDFFLAPRTDFIDNLIVFETELTAWMLNLFPIFKGGFASLGNVLLYNTVRVFRIGEECSGLVLFVVFAGFIIAFPGDWKSKSWFIPLGIVAIFFINILRFMFLAINKLYFKSMFNFNHHVTFTYLVYAIIFAFWMLWMNKFRVSSTKQSA